MTPPANDPLSQSSGFAEGAGRRDGGLMTGENTRAMDRRLFIAAAAGCLIPGAGATAQVGGNLAALPAVDLRLAITTGADGRPVLSPQEFSLTTGEYYRMNISSDGGAMWRVEADDLLQNVHLRLLTVGEVEIHLQGLTFRAIEFDETGEARFTFTPIKPGAYSIDVGPDPNAAGRPIGSAGLPPGERTARARVMVR